MAYTAVQDRAVITVSYLATTLRMPEAQMQTEIASLAIAAAKEQADAYLQNLFLDSDGVTELAIPATVVYGCISLAARFYRQEIAGVQKTSFGDFKESYDEMATDMQVKRMWRPYKKIRIAGGRLDVNCINTARRDYTGNE